VGAAGLTVPVDLTGQQSVTLTRADGRQVMRESRGAFPDMTPVEE